MSKHSVATKMSMVISMHRPPHDSRPLSRPHVTSRRTESLYERWIPAIPPIPQAFCRYPSVVTDAHERPSFHSNVKKSRRELQPGPSNVKPNPNRCIIDQHELALPLHRQLVETLAYSSHDASSVFASRTGPMSGPDPRSRTKEVFTLVIAGGSLEGVGIWHAGSARAVA